MNCIKKELEALSESIKEFLDIKEKYGLYQVDRHHKVPEVHMSPKKFLEVFKNMDNIVDCIGTENYRFKYFKVVAGVKYYCLNEEKINFGDKLI